MFVVGRWFWVPVGGGGNGFLKLRLFLLWADEFGVPPRVPPPVLRFFFGGGYACLAKNILVVGSWFWGPAGSPTWGAP